MPPLPPQGSADAVRIISEGRSRRGIFLAVYQGNQMLEIGRLSFLEELPDSGRKGEVMEAEEEWKPKKEEGEEEKEGSKEVGKEEEEWKKSAPKKEEGEEEKEGSKEVGKEEEEWKKSATKKEEEEGREEEWKMSTKKGELEEEMEGLKEVEKEGVEVVATVLLKLWPGFSHATLALYCRGRWKTTRAYRVQWLSNRDKWFGSSGGSIAASSIFTTWRINLICGLEFEGYLASTSDCIGLNDIDKVTNIEGLAQGGSSQVYQCDYLDGHYALKSFTGYFNHEEPREIDIMSSLENDTTVTFYQAWFDSKKQRFHILMEFCERTLAEFICCGNERTTAEEKLMLFEKIAKAVKYIHQRGVIHRDLKPANMFYGMDGTLKIGDFGQSCWNERGEKGSHILGSVCYSAPELTDRNAIVTEKVDIFSIGIIYLEIFVPYKDRFMPLYDLWCGKYNLKWPIDMELLKKLTARCPSNRPSIDEVLESISSKRTKTVGGEEDKAGGSDKSRSEVGVDDEQDGGGKKQEDNASINKNKESISSKRTKTVGGEEDKAGGSDKSRSEVRVDDEQDGGGKKQEDNASINKNKDEANE
ncbi:unnamed protein product [Urochloa decumbens]|uniref:Protein kinase domain-containing protein n=1 Tax=Urochloa decumbens TaxID=240449 RepID=A0ABC9CUE5_9POAL